MKSRVVLLILVDAPSVKVKDVSLSSVLGESISKSHDHLMTPLTVKLFTLTLNPPAILFRRS